MFIAKSESKKNSVNIWQSYRQKRGKLFSQYILWTAELESIIIS